MQSAFRLTKTRYISSALDGLGAARVGGRWNSRGTACVYTSSSLSLATLELLVHLDDYEVLRKLYSYIEIEIPENLIEVVDPSHLSSGWDSLTPQAASQSVGDVWVKEGRSAVLAVPSVVSQGELNYLLNPSHADFKLLKKGSVRFFALDPRIHP